MSTKKKILGLVAIAIACATLGLALLSCSSYGQQREVEFGYLVVEIDGCEYLHKRVYKGAVLAHKGNCKYCAQRKCINQARQ